MRQTASIIKLDYGIHIGQPDQCRRLTGKMDVGGISKNLARALDCLFGMRMSMRQALDNQLDENGEKRDQREHQSRAKGAGHVVILIQQLDL